ncbi:DUF397 domain-containing protein [Streptomyces sp. AC627_RSS907]|uniref:DUF397 domain-containing protein n=1 Tax=Streptomyces sp. AC627_RSS907 TaxID=2823684 RepID=UPI0027E5100C|nr:DUF397 domain-containing protein [Streptomyces sp. AC627_RSS907]
MATCPETVHVRDSKAPQDAQLAVSPAAWTRFLRYTAAPPNLTPPAADWPAAGSAPPRRPRRSSGAGGWSWRGGPGR